MCVTIYIYIYIYGAIPRARLCCTVLGWAGLGCAGWTTLHDDARSNGTPCGKGVSQNLLLYLPDSVGGDQRNFGQRDCAENRDASTPAYDDSIRGPRSTVRMVLLRTSTIIGYYRI